MTRMVPLRRYAKCLDGRRVPLNSQERAGLQGEIPYWGANGVVDHVREYLFDETLVLLGEDGAPFDDPLRDVAFLVDGKIWPNNHIHVLRPGADVDPRFLTYALNAVDWMPHVGGSTRLKLTQDEMMSIELPNIPLTEQQAVADYLDAETTRVHALVAKKQQLIRVLEERVNTFASDLVAGHRHGESTGIPTIPVVPGDWRAPRNKTLMREINDPSVEGEEELLSVSHLTGVTPRSQKTVYMFEAESTVGYKLVRPGDLVINTMWAWMGAAGVAFEPGIVSPAYGVYRIDQTVADPRWVDLLIRTKPYIVEMTRFSRGVTSSRLRLYPEEFLSLQIPLPPLAQQSRLVAEFETYRGQAFAAAAALTRQVELLNERRQALITSTLAGGDR